MARLLRAVALLALFLVAHGVEAFQPLKVVGRDLKDAHFNTIQIRGVNVPVYKSGYADDLDAVAAAIAATQANAVRMEWWSSPPAGTTEYTLAHFDRAIQKFYSLGLITVVELHDLTFQYGHDGPAGPLADGNDQAVFKAKITDFWTRPDVLAILLAHNDHIIVNIANEWGSSRYSDGTSAAENFIQNYRYAIAALRANGVTAPLMIDAPKGFEYQLMLDRGAELLAADPLHNTILSVHTYWDPAHYPDLDVNTIFDAFAASGLPFVLGEASSNAYTEIPCDPIHYQNLLTRANAKGIGYLFWAWYEDGQCGQEMNITRNGGDGVTLPTPATPGFGYDALYHPSFGINAALPATRKADFSVMPVAMDGPPDLRVHVQASPDPAGAGKDVTFTFTAYAGVIISGEVTNVSVSIAYDPTAAVIWVSPGCVKSASLALYTCALGTLIANTQFVQLKLVLRPSAPGAVFTHATISGDESEMHTSNNYEGKYLTVLPSAPGVQTQRYRLFSPVTHEHHFTTDLNEYNVLGTYVGTWVQEGTVGKVLNNPGQFNGVAAVPYYRLYNTGTAWHHWTTDANEYYTLIQYPGWNGEGVDGYLLPTGPAGSTPLYRLVYPYVAGGLHHWTIDANEYNTLIGSYGWIGEGGSGFVIQ